MSAKEPTIYMGVDTIRRVQELMILCSLLPPDGKLREVLERALAMHEEPVLSRISPISDLHPHAAKAWLESIWLQDGLSAAEKELVDWQSNSANMAAAIQELKDVEQQIGIRLVAEKVS
ncbi:MAG TPA: DurN family substrate-assisted peptide maturase [Streptosporangiaceae bacterium]|nr:DurN family substrate-assisted peptide maturase [Streptosporangiaceae bacterium]